MFHAWQNSRTESQTAQPTSLEIGQPMKSHYPPTSDFSCVYLVPQFNDWSGGKVQGVQLVTHWLSANLLPQTWKFTSLWFPIRDSGKVGKNKLLPRYGWNGAWCYMSVLSCFFAVLVSSRVAWSSQNRLLSEQNRMRHTSDPPSQCTKLKRLQLRLNDCPTPFFTVHLYLWSYCHKRLSRFLTSCHFSRQLTSERSQSRSSSPRSFNFGSGSLFRLKRVPQFEPQVLQAKDAKSVEA